MYSVGSKRGPDGIGPQGAPAVSVSVVRGVEKALRLLGRTTASTTGD